MLQFHPTRALRVNAFHHAFHAAPAGASTAANTAGGGKRGEARPRTPKATAASLAVLPSTPASFLSTKKKTRKSLDFGPETRHGGGGGGDGDGGGVPLPARKRQKSMKPMKELAAQQAKPSATPSRKHRKLPSTRTQPGTPNEKKKKKNRAQFVVKLFDMLNAKRHADIVSWLNVLALPEEPYHICCVVGELRFLRPSLLFLFHHPPERPYNRNRTTHLLHLCTCRLQSVTAVVDRIGLQLPRSPFCSHPP